MSNREKMMDVFECAVADFNRHNARRIRMADGLLHADNQDIEIRCEAGFGSDDGSICVLLLPLRQETVLAELGAPQLFNLIASIEPGVSLAFAPYIRMDSEMIRVIGVEAVVPLKCLNRHSLEDLIGRLLVSAGCLQFILSGEAGSRDYWHERLYCASRIPSSVSGNAGTMQHAALEF